MTNISNYIFTLLRYDETLSNLIIYWNNKTVYVDYTKYFNLLLNLNYPAKYVDKYIHIISNTRYLQLVKNNGENNIETEDFTWNETKQIYIRN